MAEEIVLRFRPEEERIIAEIPNPQGVVTTKELTADDVLACVRSSFQYDAPGITTGLLPPRCLSFGCGGGVRDIAVEYPHRYANFTYHETVYPHFPLPRMVFSFSVDGDGAVIQCRIGIVGDGDLKPDTAMFVYPFSNMLNPRGTMCLGSNELPKFKKLYTIDALCSLILSLPNNDDNFEVANNMPRLGYRELLEHLKNQDPSYYYGNILIPSSTTLKQFLLGGGSDIEA